MLQPYGQNSQETWNDRSVRLLVILLYSLTHWSTIVDDGWRQQMTTLLSFFSTSTVPCLVTSPSAECSYNHSTLLCRPSIVFWVLLGDVNHLPSKTVSAKFPALLLVTCPKYCSFTFIRANFPVNSLSRPISSSIDLLVRCSFQEIPSNRVTPIEIHHENANE